MKKINLLLFIMIVLTLSACKNEKHFVSFITNGGTPIKKQELKNINYNLEVVPTKDGYTFVGWFFDVELLNDFEVKQIKNEDLTLYAKWEKIKFTKTELIDLYIFAYNNHLNSKTSEAVSLGEVTTKVLFTNVSQKIKSVKQVKDNIYYQFRASYGSSLNIMYEIYGSKDSLTYVKGKTNNNLELAQVSLTKQVTTNDYIKEFGMFINDFNYIVNHETVIDVNNHLYIDNTHYFDLTLDLEKSVVNYIKNIKRTNDLPSEDVKFSKIVLSVEVDKEGIFKKILYDEVYNIRVKVPILGWRNQEMKSLITETFNYNPLKINIDIKSKKEY